MAIYFAAHLIQLVSASAHVLLISGDSCVSLGQKLRFHGILSLIYCLYLRLDGGFRPTCREELKGTSPKKPSNTRLCRRHSAGCHRSVRPYATGRSLSLGPFIQTTLHCASNTCACVI